MYVEGPTLCWACAYLLSDHSDIRMQRKQKDLCEVSNPLQPEVEGKGEKVLRLRG